MKKLFVVLLLMLFHSSANAGNEKIAVWDKCMKDAGQDVMGNSPEKVEQDKKCWAEQDAADKLAGRPDKSSEGKVVCGTWGVMTHEECVAAGKKENKRQRESAEEMQKANTKAKDKMFAAYAKQKEAEIIARGNCVGLPGMDTAPLEYRCRDNGVSKEEVQVTWDRFFQVVRPHMDDVCSYGKSYACTEEQKKGEAAVWDYMSKKRAYNKAHPDKPIHDTAFQD